MVELIDTHSHIFVDDFEDKNAIVKNAIADGVTMILMPNIDISSINNIKTTHQHFKETTRVMMGLHPSSVDTNYEEVLKTISKEFEQGSCCAVGEIGLDFYWSTEFKKEQFAALEIQLQWAIDMDLPVSLHTRNATQETIDLCKNFSGLRGVFHCFGGSIEEANKIIELGMYLGIGGVLTFKNAGLAETILNVNMEHLVLETDSPYLAPHPNRGKRNEPAYLKLVAEKLAKIKSVTFEEVAKQTSLNAKKIFNL